MLKVCCNHYSRQQQNSHRTRANHTVSNKTQVDLADSSRQKTGEMCVIGHLWIPRRDYSATRTSRHRRVCAHLINNRLSLISKPMIQSKSLRPVCTQPPQSRTQAAQNLLQFHLKLVRKQCKIFDFFANLMIPTQPSLCNGFISNTLRIVNAVRLALKSNPLFTPFKEQSGRDAPSLLACMLVLQRNCNVLD